LEWFFIAKLTGKYRSKRGNPMHEVKVYDSSGNLKKVISVQALNIRSKQQMEVPSLFRKSKKPGRVPDKPAASQEKA